MANRAELEQFIGNAVGTMGGFHSPNPALLHADILNDFIDAGFALLEHYQSTGDTQVDEQIIGTYVDCAMVMNALAADAALSDDERVRAEEIMVGLEDLVNAITHAVEQNIANAR